MRQGNSRSGIGGIAARCRPAFGIGIALCRTWGRTAWSHGKGSHVSGLVTCRFTTCALVLLASTALLSPAGAEEDSAGLFGDLSDLLKQPEGSTSRVPKRRKTKASKSDESVQELPPIPRVVVPKRRHNEAVQPPPPAAAPALALPPADREPVRLAPATAPASATEPATATAPATAFVPAAAAATAPIDEPERGERGQSSHVLRAIQDLISEIGILREELNVHDYPPEAELVERRAPIHVYAKSLETLTKIVEVQRRLGVPAGRAGGAGRSFPFKEVDNGDVLAHVELLLGELRAIKAHMNIDRGIQPARLDPEATSAMAYNRLADASLMLDGLRGRPVMPDDVYRSMLSVLDEMVLIAEHLDVPLELAPPPVEGTRKPFDVALQIKRGTYRLVSLQTRLQMDASHVPVTTLARVVTPSMNLDATYLLLAEMARIKLHIGIDVPRAERPDQPQGRSPNDVFALAMLIDSNLDNLAVAAAR